MMAATTGVRSVSPAMMFASVMPTAMPTAVSSAMSTAVPTSATFRNGIAAGRQDGRENDDCNSEIELRHGTLTARLASTQRSKRRRRRFGSIAALPTRRKPLFCVAIRRSYSAFRRSEPIRSGSPVGRILAMHRSGARKLCQIRATVEDKMKIEHHFETRRATALREAKQIETMIRDLNQAAERLGADVVAEERRAGISDPHNTAYPILARVLSVRRENLMATIAVLEQRAASLRQIFPELAEFAA
jgi:hypothetical protein